MVFLACMHLALFLALPLSKGNSLVSSWCDHSIIASVLWQCLTVSNSSLFTLALLRTHSFVFFTVQKTNRISVHSSQRRQDVFLRLLSVHFYSRTLLQVLSFVVSSLTSVCSGFCIFSAVMPRLPYLQVANKTNNASKYI